MYKYIKAVILIVLLVLACIIGNKLLNENMVTQYTVQNEVDIYANPDAININTADAIKLDEIKHVGETIAGKIIEYRNEFGEFRNIEQIKNVDGIGDKTYEDIKNYITVEQEE